jgi:hypothetical protein
MGPGSHVGFLISAKNKNLVYDHPLKISAKFGSWHEWSLGGQLSKLCPVTPTSIQDGRRQRT